MPPHIPVGSEKAPQNNGTLLGILIPCMILVLLGTLIGFVARRKGDRLILEEKESESTFNDGNSKDMIEPQVITTELEANLSSLELILVT